LVKNKGQAEVKNGAFILLSRDDLDHVGHGINPAYRGMFVFEAYIVHKVRGRTGKRSGPTCVA